MDLLFMEVSQSLKFSSSLSDKSGKVLMNLLAALLSLSEACFAESLEDPHQRFMDVEDGSVLCVTDIHTQRRTPSGDKND